LPPGPAGGSKAAEGFLSGQSGGAGQRIPFRTTLGSDLNLIYGVNEGPTTSTVTLENGKAVTLSTLNTVGTPQNTLGSTDTELDNLTFLFKWLFYRSCYMALSGGLAVTAPTGRSWSAITEITWTSWT
jgi:hypothetical protein